MPETPIESRPVASANGTTTSALEARLSHFFAEQARLRELLEKTRAELDRVNTELMQFESEYCTNAVRISEYQHAVERLLGTDLTLDPIDMSKPMPDDGFLSGLLQRLEAVTE